MTEEARIYRTDDSRLILGTILFPVAVLIFMYFVGLSEAKLGIAAVRFIQNSILILSMVLVIVGWVFWFRKIPRLEVSTGSLKYVTYGYSVEAAWSDIERIEMFTRTQRRAKFPYEEYTVNVGRGLVASRYIFKSSKFFNGIDRWKNQGIPIEPYFATNIYIGELGTDMKQYIPHVFEHNPYLL